MDVRLLILNQVFLLWYKLRLEKTENIDQKFKNVFIHLTQLVR